MAPAADDDKGSHDYATFGAESQSLGTRCLRFAVTVTRADARLASGCLAKPGRVGLVTHRVPVKGFQVVSLHLIPFPRLSLTQRPPANTRTPDPARHLSPLPGEEGTLSPMSQAAPRPRDIRLPFVPG
jgi:hypothetical protein